MIAGEPTTEGPSLPKKRVTESLFLAAIFAVATGCGGGDTPAPTTPVATAEASSTVATTSVGADRTTVAATSTVTTQAPSTTTSTNASTTAPAPTGSSTPDKTIDRVDVTSWAYDRVQGDTYVAANNNTKTLYIYWKSFAGQDQIRSGCTSTLTLSGPAGTYTKHESNCDSYDPGTYIDVKSPGTYTATVVVHQDRHGDVTGTREVTILPYGS